MCSCFNLIQNYQYKRIPTFGYYKSMTRTMLRSESSLHNYYFEENPNKIIIKEMRTITKALKNVLPTWHQLQSNAWSCQLYWWSVSQTLGANRNKVVISGIWTLLFKSCAKMLLHIAIIFSDKRSIKADFRYTLRRFIKLYLISTKEKNSFPIIEMSHGYNFIKEETGITFNWPQSDHPIP